MNEDLREMAGDELGRDFELGRALAIFDPGAGDDSYWQRFRGRAPRSVVDVVIDKTFLAPVVFRS